MPIRPGGARRAKWDPKLQDGAFIGIRDSSDGMLIMAPSGVYNLRNVRRRPEVERWNFEFLTTLKGAPCTPNPTAGEMAAGGPISKQVVHQEVRCAEIQLQRELSWDQ